jgi:hypothetical protein
MENSSEVRDHPSIIPAQSPPAAQREEQAVDAWREDGGSERASPRGAHRAPRERRAGPRRKQSHDCEGPRGDEKDRKREGPIMGRGRRIAVAPPEPRALGVAPQELDHVQLFTAAAPRLRRTHVRKRKWKSD